MTKGAVKTWTVLFAVLLVGALWLLQVVIVKLGWNHGVVPVAGKAGGAVEGIGFWGAFWLSWALSIARGDWVKQHHAEKVASAISNLRK